jgi:hypothetical protein
LQLLIDRFDQCRDEFEQALRHTSELEKQLKEANNYINTLESDKLNWTASQNQSLFDELVGSASDMVSAAYNINPAVTLNFSNNESFNNTIVTQGIVKCSKNKIKKYAKLNKIINKSRKLIKLQKLVPKQLKLKKDRLCLLSELNNCSKHLKETTAKYELDIMTLNQKINNLQESLCNMTNKYNSSKKEIDEYTLTLNHYINNPLLKNKNLDFKRCSMESGLGALGQLEWSMSLCDPSVSEQLSLDNTNTSANHNISVTQIENECNIIFSDGVGRDLGHLLNKHLGQKVINYCESGSNYHNIMDKLFNYKFKGYENLILIIGNRGNINKISLQKYLDSMITLNVKTIVIFTFPYSNSLPQVENYHRYKLNLKLNTVSNYDDKIHVIDINKLNNIKFQFNNNLLYLPKYYRKQLASVLSYYLQNLAKKMAIDLAFIEHKQMTSASIEQSITNISTNNLLELVPSDLN